MLFLRDLRDLRDLRAVTPLIVLFTPFTTRLPTLLPVVRTLEATLPTPEETVRTELPETFNSWLRGVYKRSNKPRDERLDLRAISIYYKDNI
jgi:hypothetical protein